MRPGGFAVVAHPFFLLGRAQAYEYHVRAAGANGAGYRAVLLEIPIVRPGDF